MNIHAILHWIKASFASLKKTAVPFLGAFSSDPSRPPGPRSTPALNLVLLHLCGYDNKAALHVLQWLALAYRHQHAKMPQALLFQGGQSAGKMLYFEHLIAPVFESRGTVITPQHLTPSRLDWLYGKRLAVISEMDSIDECKETLKSLITTDTALVQRRGLPPQRIRNRANFVVLSGLATFMKDDGRRFAVFDVPGPMDQEIYAAAAAEISNGAWSAFRHYLTYQLRLDDQGERLFPSRDRDAERRAA